MKMPGNTFISFEYIKNNASRWQAHLERLSDFLLPGKNVWWNETDTGIEFYDIDEYFVDHDILPPSHPKAHHFRSSNFKQEEEYLQNTWKECIDKKISIPIHCLHIEESDESIRKIDTNFVEHLTVSESAVSPFSRPIQCNEHPEKSRSETAINPDDAEELDEDENVIGIQELDVPVITDTEVLAETSQRHGASFSTSDDCSIYNMSITVNDNDTVTDHFPVIPATSSSPSSCKHMNLFETSTPDVMFTPSDNDSLLEPESNDTVLDQSPGAPLKSSSPTSSKHVTSTKNNTTNWKPLTKLGNALSVVIGEITDVKKIDEKKDKVNRALNNVFLKQFFLDERAHIEVKVVNELKECKDKFKSWEKNFLLKNNLATATLGNIQSDKLADILYKKIKYAEALIKSWKKDRD